MPSQPGRTLPIAPERLSPPSLAWKDELFLDGLGDQTRRGMEGAIRRGYSAGGRAYGYRSEPVVENGRVIGVRRVIDPDEAAVVIRIFEWYRDGLSPQAIAHRLNDERVAPPRPSRGRRVMGWTWSTILGTPKRALGILNNPPYDWRLVWNRSRKVRDPDTERRVMRVRPESQWIEIRKPELRIVPPDLWRAVQERRTQRRSPLLGNTRGRYVSSLLSSLLVCDPCGSHYVLARPTYYGCTAHHDRGNAICVNGRLVRRDVIEDRVAQLVLDQVFAADVVEYVTEHVNLAIRRLWAPEAGLRRQREQELAQARRELENAWRRFARDWRHPPPGRFSKIASVGLRNWRPRSPCRKLCLSWTYFPSAWKPTLRIFGGRSTRTPPLRGNSCHRCWSRFGCGRLGVLSWENFGATSPSFCRRTERLPIMVPGGGFCLRDRHVYQ